MTENLNARVWNEMIDAKRTDFYLSRYLQGLKRRKQKYKFYLITISLVGAFIQFATAETFISPIILLIIAAAEVFKNLLPELYPDESLLEKLPEYRMMYVLKFEKLDELYINMINDRISEDDAFEEYFSIRKGNSQIESFDNSICLPEKKSATKWSDKQTDAYIANHYLLSDTKSEDSDRKIIENQNVK